MRIFGTIQELQTFLSNKDDIGFVPTMGALHEGHISLITRSKSECKITVCSVFVNPTQFNNPEDLKNYPRVMEKDIKILEQSGCDVLFNPSVEEMYNNRFEKLNIPLGNLDNVLEGKYRPGHFAGVITVVKKLFEIVKPQRAYFGQKDFQQVMVIQKMAKHFHLPVKIIPCEIIREPGGLAMSSRNTLLSASEKTAAQNIYRALLKAKELFNKKITFDLIKEEAGKIINQAGLTLEYLEFADSETLSLITKNESEKTKVVCLIAAYSGKVRLIDNMFLN